MLVGYGCWLYWLLLFEQWMSAGINNNKKKGIDCPRRKCRHRIRLNLLKSLSHRLAKSTKWHMHPAQTQISLDVSPDDQSSLPARRKLGSLATLWVHSEYTTDKTGWISMFICLFPRRPVILLVLSCAGSYGKDRQHYENTPIQK